MGWLLDEHGRASAGQWLGVALLAAGVLTGQLRAPQLLYAAWLENIAVGVAATTALARSGRSSVHVPGWLRGYGRRGGPRQVRAPSHVPSRSEPPPWGGSELGPPVSSPPPPPPGARPTAARPADHISAGLALVVLVFSLLMVTSFQGQFIATMATIGRFGQDDGGASTFAGGRLAMALLLVAAAARAFRRIDPDEALGHAFGHIVALHLGIFLGFFAMVAAVIGGLATGTSASTPLEVVATLLLVVWFAAIDRLRVGRGRRR